MHEETAQENTNFLRFVCFQIFIGDELKAVDGVLVRGLKPAEVAMLIRGPVRSTVELEVSNYLAFFSFCAAEPLSLQF